MLVKGQYDRNGAFSSRCRSSTLEQQKVVQSCHCSFSAQAPGTEGPSSIRANIGTTLAVVDTATLLHASSTRLIRPAVMFYLHAPRRSKSLETGSPLRALVTDQSALDPSTRQRLTSPLTHQMSMYVLGYSSSGNRLGSQPRESRRIQCLAAPSSSACLTSATISHAQQQMTDTTNAARNGHGSVDAYTRPCWLQCSPKPDREPSICHMKRAPHSILPP